MLKVADEKQNKIDVESINEIAATGTAPTTTSTTTVTEAESKPVEQQAKEEIKAEFKESKQDELITIHVSYIIRAKVL